MLAALDSETPPTPAAAAAAIAAGYGLWSGYLATRPNVRIANPWTQADFDVARVVGATPIAYASGWDDPVAVRALALRWNVRPCLDVESSIRPDDGTWSVQEWLNRAGAGLYGNQPVHRYAAAFHVLAAYPTSGDPLDASWGSTGRPPGPCGWQYSDLGHIGGIGVDLSWLDDYFAAPPPVPAQQEDDDMLRAFTRLVGGVVTGTDSYRLNPSTGRVTHWFEGVNAQPPYGIEVLPGLWTSLGSGGVSDLGRLYFHGVAGLDGGSALWATENPLDGSGWTAPQVLVAATP